MLTEELRLKVVELKAEVGTRAGRAAVVELKRDVRAGGGTARELARELGVHESTLCRWEREVRAARGRKVREASSQGESRFRLVKVAASKTESATGTPTAGPEGGGLRVAHAPSGMLIEGLDLDGLVALLQRMSCSSGR